MPGETKYHGIIKWVLKHKQLLLIPELVDESKKEKMITYAREKKGTNLDCYYCSPTFQNFVYAYSGPYGDGQWWESQGLQTWLWMAALQRWGYPRRKGSTPGSKPDVYFKEEAVIRNAEYKS